jgi:hypothetical protein
LPAILRLRTGLLRLLFADCLAPLPWRTSLGPAAGLSAAAAVARFGSAFARLPLAATRGLPLAATCRLSLTATRGLSLTTAPAVSSSASGFPARRSLPLATFDRAHERYRDDANSGRDGERFDTHNLEIEQHCCQSAEPDFTRNTTILPLSGYRCPPAGPGEEDTGQHPESQAASLYTGQ